MKQFRLLRRSRQVTEYSCGASALQAVLNYWGRDVDEEELMKLIGTNEDVGTYPEGIVHGARSLGFAAEAKENLTLSEVEAFTAQGHPMIALAQVWRSHSRSNMSVADEWDNGHYIVVLGVDRDYVYFQDPYIRMGKGFAPRQMFEEHWHQVMGGDLANNPKLIHLGIFIRGEKPAPPADDVDLDLSTIDFSRIGSVNLMVTQFPGMLLPYDFLTELRDIWDSGIVRPNAFILLRKDRDGRVSGMEGGRLQEDTDVAEINALVAAIAAQSVGRPELVRSKVQAAALAAAQGDFGLSAGDIHRIAEKLPPDHSAIIILFENLWERRFKDVAAKYDGTVINQRLISSAALAELGRDLAAASAAETGRD